MSRLIACDPQLSIKLELDNPGGSHKYRAASHIVARAIEAGEIVPGHTTVIEKTGGNFGFGLLAACQKRNVDVALAIGLGFSQFKRDLLEGLGAELIGKMQLLEGATPREVIEHHLAHQHTLGRHYYYTDQFNNVDNVQAHRCGTGVELGQQLLAAETPQRLLFVGCAGTGASFTGVVQALRDMGFDVRAVLVEPDGCDTRTGHFVDHRLEGMCVGVTPPFLDWTLVSDVYRVNLAETLSAQRHFYRDQGFHVGNTTGACLAVAQRLREQAAFEGRHIVMLGYDGGHWYPDLTQEALSGTRDAA
ncbi:pyridoxal-5'-phosphate-dependent protein [Kushneria pakistanensis]|uniref:cysteine synthase n=1 Tax=Kushneria pakistanensis TaxID=1508770 RepID=A0ABQ3FHF3_9GAMM|nr:pyridoxal-phosphate dependent enzyme [Kushneria pakistanensis]GHC23553.1 pyridoxal-5'-phosphate-dependent protein [Kushneria pakistanensis]